MEDIAIFLTFYPWGRSDLTVHQMIKDTNNEFFRKQTIYEWAAWLLVNYLNAVVLAFVLEGKTEGRILLPNGVQPPIPKSI